MAASTKLKKNNAVKTEEPSPFSPAQIKTFVDEVKAEFFKIVWPDKKTTLGLTGIVVTLTVVLALYLGSVDLLLGKVISMFLNH
jgi:preprotein translocase subunit SecE